MKCHAHVHRIRKKAKPSTSSVQSLFPSAHLSGGDGLAPSGTTLPRGQVLATLNSLRLLDNLVTLGQDQFDVAGVRHVRVDLEQGQLIMLLYFEESRLTYATVGTVSAAALLGSLVDLDVLDDQVAGVETLGIGVGLGVLEETEEELGRLHGPAGTGDAPGLAYCSEPNQHDVLERP